MTALDLAEKLRLFYVVGSLAVAVAVLCVQGVLHRQLHRPGARTVPDNFWRALKLCFGVAFATFIVSLAFPAKDLAGSPPVMAAMLLLGIGGLVTATLFVLATWQLFVTSYRKSVDKEHAPKANGHGDTNELWPVPKQGSQPRVTRH